MVPQKHLSSRRSRPVYLVISWETGDQKWVASTKTQSAETMPAQLPTAKRFSPTPNMQRIHPPNTASFRSIMCMSGGILQRNVLA